MRSNLVSIKRSLWAPKLSSSVAGTGQGLAFTLNGLPGFTEFTSLFEYYRICAVKVTFLPRQNNVTMQTDSNLLTVIDTNDVTQPTNTDELNQYSTVRVHNGFKQFSLYFKPRVAMPVWQGISASGYGPGRPNQWLDTNSPAIQHYGLKFFWATSMTGLSLDIRADYYCQFKGAK